MVIISPFFYVLLVIYRGAYRGSLKEASDDEMNEGIPRSRASLSSSAMAVAGRGVNDDPSASDNASSEDDDDDFVNPPPKKNKG